MLPTISSSLHSTSIKLQSACRQLSHCSVIKTESIETFSNLHRLVPIPESPYRALRHPYSNMELQYVHSRLVNTANRLALQAEQDQSIGHHGTLKQYEPSLCRQVALMPDSDGSGQLGEGFYIAVDSNSRESAELYANMISFQRKREIQKPTLKIEDESLAHDEHLDPVVLDVKVQSFRSMRGLIVPKKCQWSKAVADDGVKQCRWVQDEVKKEFIESFDYIIASFDSPLLSDSTQVKFNPRSFEHLEIVPEPNERDV